MSFWRDHFVSRILPLLLIVSPTLICQAQAAKGQKELSLSGDIFVPVQATATSTGLVAFDISKYFTRTSQAGIGSSFTLFGDSQPVYNSKNVQTGTQNVLAVISDPHVFYRYNFSRGEEYPMVPYLGVEAGTSIQSDGNTTQLQDNFYARPHVGFKYYFSKRAAFDLNGGYQAVLKNSSNGTIDTRFGISMLF